VRLPDAAVEATEVIHLPGLLSDADIQHIFDAAADLSGNALPTADDPNRLEIEAYPHHERSPSVATLHLNRNNHWASFCPALSDKISHAMRSQPGMYTSPQIKLSIRCVEFNTYTPTRPPRFHSQYTLSRGHRDTGSLLTISMLLTDPDDVVGGTFVTCCRAGGKHVAHLVARGDALLFFSEKLHNVTPVSAGVRHSLVIELWQGKANTVDRFG
jgi:predicted 2-oxoglutarate/Fe(II)-dependent dioxygenase YbiX